MGVVACVGPNKFQPWKALADLVEDEPSPLSATGCRGSRRWGWPRGRAPRAAPYEVLPRCAPRPRRAGTAGRYCRPSSAEETGRAADTARDSPCVGDRDCVHRRAHVRRARPPPGLRGRDQRLQTLPLRIGQIAGKGRSRLPVVALCAWVHIPNQSLRAISEAVNHGASVSARSFWVRLLEARY